NESHVFATILAIPNHRLKATSDTVVTFAERAAGEPRAIRAWFYPGETWGQEFVYPKTKAAQLAKIAEAPVLYIPDEVAPNIVVPAVTATEPEVVALKEAPLRAVTPSGEDIAIAEALAPPAAPIPAVVAAEPRVIALPPPEAEAIVPRISAASATPEPEPRFIDRTEDPSAIEGARSSPVLTARLPATASNLPMLALIGLLCIGLGVSLRALCAR
ncbi:MAG TPA: hypothetical protein VFY29_00310, partial [Terriglobia bacterium]|nr:hypothetical protein [Terriglobia bacterium]